MFIPIAEERGIIGPLSQLVLRKATEAARNWPQDLFLSFNLSPSQLVDQNTGLHILAILDRTGFDPRRLEIEITETGLMTDPASAEKIVEDLRRCGIRVSLDDFGTGQSVARPAARIPLRQAQDRPRLRRRRSSTTGPPSTSSAPSLQCARAWAWMSSPKASRRKRRPTRLIEFGCAGGQGYLFGRPVDADATLGYLRDLFRGAQRTNSI